MAAIDLSMMKRTTDVAGGFLSGQGFVRTVKNMQSGGEAMVPVLALKFIMVNGEERKEVCIPLPMVMPLLAELTQFGLQHTQMGAGEEIEVTSDNG